VEIVDLAAIDGHGPAWGTASEELNATLLVWRPGEGQPEHVNAERDVALVVLEGAGLLVVGGENHSLTAGGLAIVPRGARRSIVAGPEGLRCLTVHRRRGGLGMTDFTRNPGFGPQSDTSPDARRTKRSD
jgi:mannose-6-phosphate isomerase-like protein (cupin superfamily)